jgi:hypothetical protein
MIRRERRVTGPRFRDIVAGERGAVEYVTLAGFPLAMSARELCERWRAAGKDEEVIWRALEERYSQWA